MAAPHCAGWTNYNFHPSNGFSQFSPHQDKTHQMEPKQPFDVRILSMDDHRNFPL